MENQQPLKTDYKDYTFMENKKFKMINNSDGTFSFEDVTDYIIEGDDFGASDINATNTRINEMKEKNEQAVYNDEINNCLVDQTGAGLNPTIQQYEDFVNDYSNLFKFQHFSLPVYIGANANVSTSVGQIHTPSGYTLLGVLPLENGYSDQWQVTYSRYGTGVQAYIKSYHSSDLQATLQCVAVYVKTNYYNQNLVS